MNFSVSASVAPRGQCCVRVCVLVGDTNADHAVGFGAGVSSSSVALRPRTPSLIREGQMRQRAVNCA